MVSPSCFTGWRHRSSSLRSWRSSQSGIEKFVWWLCGWFEQICELEHRANVDECWSLCVTYHNSKWSSNRYTSANCECAFKAGTIIDNLQQVTELDSIPADEPLRSYGVEAEGSSCLGQQQQIPDYIQWLVDGVHSSLPESTRYILSDILVRYLGS